MKEVINNYLTGMSVYDCCHQPNIYSQWLAFKDEIAEFIEEPSLAEIWDTLHSAGRLIWKVTGIPLQLLAYPTVYKHSQRFAKNGCIRSIRNCEGRCCNGNNLTEK
ncbi:MAG: hypothetical protein WBG73_21680 [Coleofasciculaceae cyanobacterium]